jgi:spore maturation protein CgeB
MNIVILGLSITSSWGNGHATTWRGLVRQLGANGHDVLFLERDVPWYAEQRDDAQPPGCTTRLYQSLAELSGAYQRAVREADLVLIGSYVPEGMAVAEWAIDTAQGLVAFYDIDTPVTLAALRRGDCHYLTAELVPRFDLYLSFTGGPTLRRIESELGAQRARALYCSFDPNSYYPESRPARWDLGYLGTYSDDRQPVLDRLLTDAAKEWPGGTFVVAGPQYPESIRWPGNVERVAHLPPDAHRGFYNSLRFTLNVTRVEMVRAGWSPSVRLFEAAACGVPIISDWWEGLSDLFEIGSEIIVARDTAEVLRTVRELDEQERQAIGERARLRVMREHTAAHRAAELEAYVAEVAGTGITRARIAAAAKAS